MPGINIQFRGLDQLQQRVNRLARGSDLERAVAGKLFRSANRVLTESKRLVPVDTGNLKATGSVEVPDVGGSRVTTEVGYGGSAAPYALVVHEDLEAFHDDGSAKYLEIPFRAEAEGTLRELRKVISLLRGTRGGAAGVARGLQSIGGGLG